jgi:hypothetical protein
MWKHTALAALIGLATVSTAAAQDPGTAGAPAQANPIAKSMTLAAQHIRQGVRAGEITPGELARLRTDAQALRSRLRALRQAGEPLTPEQRLGVRRDLRRLHREIFIARHNRIRRPR